MLNKVGISISDIIGRCHGDVTDSVLWMGSEGGSASQAPVAPVISELAWEVRVRCRIGT